jgi:retinol-binding protein 3
MPLLTTIRGVHSLVPSAPRKGFRRVLFISTFLFAAAAAACAQIAVPDTPAGKTLGAWLDAFNSGDRAKVEAYVKKYEPDQAPDRMLAFHDQTGGFDLLSIESSEPLLIKFRVKEKASATVGIGSIHLKDAQSGVIENFSLQAIPADAVVESVKLDAAERSRVIDGVSKNLKEAYVYPDLAQKMEEAVRAKQKRGEYDSITDPDTFADRLTKDLREISHDKHLGVHFSPVKLPPDLQKPSAEEEAESRKMLERSNCEFEKVEVLPRNIGYLKFNAFANPTICGPTVVAAMNFLAHVDAIIFDLRENGGGDPKMVAMVSSYLFDKPTHLNDLYNRQEDFTQQYWTLPYVPGTSLASKPAFVLTSKKTFSGAEEFTYNLKNLKRATIVGETTGGGAHPVSGHRVDDHFMIGVPFARAVSPITKTNWEGTGVEPDVKVPAADALQKAEDLAATKLAQSK